MRIVIPTTGSRGDVQPYVALGKGLHQSGYRVCVATHGNFESFVRGHGLDFYCLEPDGQALQSSDTGDRMVQAGARPFRFLREFCRLREPLVRGMMENCLHACEGADLLLLTNTEFLIGLSVAEKLRLPTIWTSLQPITPTRREVNSLFSPAPWWLPTGGLYNLATHFLTSEMLWQWQRRALNEARREVLGLAPLFILGPLLSYFCPPLCLDGFSAHVVQRPRDQGRRHLTGFWHLQAETGWQAPARLRDFLAAGPPPVYVGFGSMHNRDADAMTDLIVQALKQAGQRGVVYTGWAGLRRVEDSDRLLSLESGTPHDWLFPRMAAVVHHGGAGTTAAALRAGVPAVIVPFMSDQPYWGRRVQELGAGPAPIPRGKLTVDRLADAIRRAATEESYQYHAGCLGMCFGLKMGSAAPWNWSIGMCELGIEPTPFQIRKPA